MYQAWNDYMSSKYAGQGIKLEIRSGDLNFNTSGKTAADYIAVYDAIQETMTKAADLASSEGYNIALESETYNAARNYLEQNAEAYQKLVEARDLLKDATI
jgi:Zn-dependent metalloprotease